jgi:hypothetical protein
MNSVKKWALSSHGRVKQNNGRKAIEQIHNRRRTQLLADNRKNRQLQMPSTSRQGSIVGFLSLLQHLK